jgi:predicted transcriptional regulator
MTGENTAFNFRISTELKELVDDKGEKTRISPSAIITMAFQDWLDNQWEPILDDGLKHDGQALVRIDPDLMIRVMEKRRETGMNVSAVARDALRKWVEGEWSVVLV